jgi:transcriptional regulator with XRE-family HTH domain
MAQIAETAAPHAVDKAAAVLSKAVVRAAQRLELSQAQLARILGLSSATASRLAGGSWMLAPDSKPWELATVLVRITRSLDAITGGRPEAMRSWLHSDNAAFSMPPSQRMLGAEGLIDVLHYLDAARSRI